MPLTVGRDTFVATGVESTFGTAVTVDRWHRVIKSGLRRKITRVVRPHLVGSDTAAMARSHFQQNDLVEGDVELECYYEGFGRWLHHALWKTPTTTGTNPYTHTYLMGLTAPTMTIEQAIGRPVSGNRRAEVFEGMVMASARISITVGDVMRFSASFIGETSQTRADASGAATYSTNDVPVVFHQAGALNFNLVTYTRVTQLEWAIENAIDRRMHLGSLVTKEPVSNGFRKVTLRATLEYEDENLWAAYLADIQGDVVITFTNASRTIAFTLQNGFMTDYSDPIQGAGVIIRTVEWTGESDGADDGIKIVVVNTQASALGA